MTELLIQTVVQGVLVGGGYALVALSLGLTYNVSGIINFAHGDFLTLAMYLALALQAAWALDPYVSTIITFPLLFISGVALYWFLLRPVARSQLLMVIQLTLGVTFVLQNGILMVFGGQPVRVPSDWEASLLIIGDSLFLRTPQVLAFAGSLLLALLLWIVLDHTETGRRIRAVHQNPRAAALMGIDVPRVRTLTFGVGIGIQAIAGALLIPGTPIEPGQGFRYTVIPLMALVMGGLSDFRGIYLAAILIGVTEALGTVFVSGTSGMIVPYALFVLVLLLRPQGLFRRA
jgi:branched-chain amino acid transport system permease protein